MESPRTAVLLETRARRRSAQHGQRIASRKRIPAGTRFIVDPATKLVHDLAREKLYCGLEEGFKDGRLQVFQAPLRRTQAVGFRVDEACIGDRPSDTFDGRTTVLLRFNVPFRETDIVRDITEREDFKLRLMVGFERNGDRIRMHEELNRFGVPAIFFQALRLPVEQRAPALWGEPVATIQVAKSGRNRLGKNDDVLTDIFIPQTVIPDTKNHSRLARDLMQAVFRTKTVRDAFGKHFARHGYRDLVLYGHACETVDDWIVPKPRPECTVSSGGSGGGGGGGRGVGRCY